MQVSMQMGQVPRDGAPPIVGLPASGSAFSSTASGIVDRVRAAAVEPGLRLHPVGDPGRAEVEDFIRGVYAQRFGAELTAFAPVLVSLRDAQGLAAAVGYRPAVQGALFLERYLAGPVEGLLCPGQAAPPREAIVEVGHLAATRAGEGRRLIQAMAPLLAAQGFQWVVATFTEELRHLFVRLGIVPLALAAADPARLGADASRWGQYYQHQPVVLAGQLLPALRRFDRLAGRAALRAAQPDGAAS